jgi:uncharacterized metal-binding protein
VTGIVVGVGTVAVDVAVASGCAGGVIVAGVAEGFSELLHAARMARRTRALAGCLMREPEV